MLFPCNVTEIYEAEKLNVILSYCYNSPTSFLSSLWHSLTHKHAQKQVWAPVWAFQILSAFVRHAVTQSFTCAVLWVSPPSLSLWSLSKFILTHHILSNPDSQNFGAALQFSLSLFGSVPAAGVYSGLPVSLLLSLTLPPEEAPCLLTSSIRGEGRGAGGLRMR